MSSNLTRLPARILNRLRGRSSDEHPALRFALRPEEAPDYFPAPITPLERAFLTHRGRTAHKWTHYLAIYEKIFAPYRGRPICFLELGVNMGGSLELWRDYFGDGAVIAGIDIDEDCATRFDPPNRVFIGSQADPAFLDEVLAAIGRPDIVLDDGSHVAGHQAASFKTLFPQLRDGGLYVIEDTHTSYWPQMFDGGYRRRGTAIELAKDLVDDMHAWYHPEHFDPLIRDHVASVAFHDSVIVIEKKRRLPPRHLRVPGEQPAKWRETLDGIVAGGAGADGAG